MSFIVEHPVVSLSAGLAAFIVARKIHEALTSPIRHVSSPGGAHWLWGHELTSFERPSGEAYTNWIESYGHTYKIKGALFHPDILVTVDTGAISHMFGKEVTSYVKSPVIRPIVDRLMGKSLVWSIGDDHKRQRYQLAPFFTTQATRNMFDTINSCARNASLRMAAEINSSPDPKHGAKLNILEWTGRATLDIIGRFAFDYDFESGESDAARAIQRSWKEQVDIGFQMAGFIGLVVLRAFPFIADLPFKAIQAQGEVKLIVRDIARSIIERNSSEIKDTSLLSALSRQVANGEVDSSNEELLDHISTLILVGHETSAGSLNFTLHELAQYPEYQTRLREEIAQLGHEPTYDDLMTKMPFLDAVMKESFRHHPISSHTERVALKDDVLRLRTPVYNDRGHKITEVPIKAGQLIHIPSISLTHLKSVWGEDAEEFRPERWLDPARLPPASETSQGWNGLFIFSEGPHNCIGYRLAILEFKVILTTYLRHFEFHDTGATVKAKFSATLQPYVVGEEAKGCQLPLRISLIDAEN